MIFEDVIEYNFIFLNWENKKMIDGLKNISST